MNWKRALWAALWTVPAVAILASGFGRDPHAIPFALLNMPAPEVSLSSLSDTAWSLSTARGTPVVMNFWATWCGPCAAEHEVLQRAAAEFAGQVAFVGVVYQDDESAARRYLAMRDNVYPQLVDPGSKIAVEYGVAGVPETFFIDAQGVIRFKQAGVVTPAVLAQGLRAAGRP